MVLGSLPSTCDFFWTRDFGVRRTSSASMVLTFRWAIIGVYICLEAVAAAAVCAMIVILNQRVKI